MQKFVLTILAIAVLTTAAYGQTAVTEASVISQVRAIPASRLEPGLGRKPFDRWLREVLGPRVPTTWSVDDCEGKPGVPGDFHGRDVRLCVNASGAITDLVTTVVSVEIGAFKHGVAQQARIEHVTLAPGFRYRGAGYHDMKEFARALAEIRRSLTRFSGTDGEFHLSNGEFEGFWSMWTPLGTVTRKPGSMMVGDVEFEIRRNYYNGKIWSFETVSIDGTRFRFKGRFAKPKLDENANTIGERVLSGRMTKFVGDKKVAEADLVFDYVILYDA